MYSGEIRPAWGSRRESVGFGIVSPGRTFGGFKSPKPVHLAAIAYPRLEIPVTDHHTTVGANEWRFADATVALRPPPSPVSLSRPLKLAAGTTCPSALHQEGISRVEGMPALAVGLCPVQRARPKSSSPVFSAGNRLKMRGVVASPLPAEMVQFQPWWHGADEQFVGEPMDPDAPVFHGTYPVSATLAARPQPALTWVQSARRFADSVSQKPILSHPGNIPKGASDFNCPMCGIL